MIATEKPQMGRIAIEMELVNYDDRVLARAGGIAPEKVRRVHLQGIVDTGAAHLVIPKTAADALGVSVVGEAGVRYADHRRATKQVVGAVEVHLLSREGLFRAIVEPDRTDALIGAIVLEDLDLIVDCQRQLLIPRDPDRILSEIE